MTEKKIGLLGLGRRATDFYLQHLPHDSDHLHIVEVDFDNDINPYLPSNELMLDGRLRIELERLEDVDAILIPNITLHETLDRIDPDGSHFPVVHAVRETIAHLQKTGTQRVTIFGSLHTMNAPDLRDQFERGGIQVTSASEEDKSAIEDFRKTVYAGGETEDDLDTYQELVESYKTSGVVVLACTELSLATPEQQGVVDMARVSLMRAL